jgi:hypothetical protein
MIMATFSMNAVIILAMNTSLKSTLSFSFFFQHLSFCERVLTDIKKDKDSRWGMMFVEEYFNISVKDSGAKR